MVLVVHAQYVLQAPVHVNDCVRCLLESVMGEIGDECIVALANLLKQFCLFHPFGNQWKRGEPGFAQIIYGGRGKEEGGLEVVQYRTAASFVTVLGFPKNITYTGRVTRLVIGTYSGIRAVNHE